MITIGRLPDLTILHLQKTHLRERDQLLNKHWL